MFVGHQQSLRALTGPVRLNTRNPYATRFRSLYLPGSAYAYYRLIDTNPRLRNLALWDRDFATMSFGTGLEAIPTRFGPAMRCDGTVNSVISDGGPTNAGDGMWAPATFGYDTPATIMAVFIQGSGIVYGFSASQFGNGGRPRFELFSGNGNVGACYIYDFGGYAEAYPPSPGNTDLFGTGQIVCAAATFRSRSDFEVAVYSFDSGAFARAVSATSVIGSETASPCETLAAGHTQLSWQSFYTGGILMCGFAYQGFTTAELRELVMSPFNLIEPTFGVAEPTMEVAAALSSRRRFVLW